MNPLKVCLTHDIDRIYKTYQYFTHTIRERQWNHIKGLFNSQRPYWMFDELAELETKYGVKSTIFFLHETLSFNPLKPSEWKLALGRYSVQDKEVAKVIRKFHQNGWEIGLHGSYYSYKKPELLKKEKHILEEALGDKVAGVRQHYLNLTEPDTWQYQRKAEFKYDASLGRTDGIGYKDSREKPFRDSESEMFVIPLTLMESYLFKAAGNNRREALKLAIEWMDYTQKIGGLYCILWHQRMFNEKEFPGYRWVYEEVLKECNRRNAEYYLCRDIESLKFNYSNV